MPQSKGTERKFLNMPSKDVYYICQMVDNSLDELGFERNIEGFMGDMGADAEAELSRIGSEYEDSNQAAIHAV